MPQLLQRGDAVNVNAIIMLSVTACFYCKAATTIINALLNFNTGDRGHTVAKYQRNGSTFTTVVAYLSFLSNPVGSGLGLQIILGVPVRVKDDYCVS